MTKRFWCGLCEEWIEHEAPEDNVMEGIAAAHDHFRLYHPEEEIDTWPDGSPVIIDNTLEPEDFAE